MTDNKKARERYFLDEFASNYPAFPPGNIVNCDPPDFLIEQKTQVIGIEIVDYIRGQSKGESEERRIEVLWQKVANLAKQKFETEHNIPLSVHFHWNKHYVLRQSEISQLADNAVSVIENIIPTKLFESVRVDSIKLDGTALEKVCHSITVLKVRNEGQSLWSFIGSGWIEVQTDEIQFLIDSKDNKMKEYLRQCDRVWLIIVADGRYVSSNIDISNAVANNIYKSSFEKVFIYDHFSKTVFPLRLQRK